MTDTPGTPLTPEEQAVFDLWFGPAADGMSVATRRAIRDALHETWERRERVDPDLRARIASLETALNDGAIGAMRYAARRLDAIEGERKTAADLRADADKLEAVLLRTDDAPPRSAPRPAAS